MSRTAVRLAVVATVALGVGLAGGSAFAAEGPQIPGLSDLAKVTEGQPGVSEPGKSYESVQKGPKSQSTSTDKETQQSDSQSTPQPSGEGQEQDSQPTTRPSGEGNAIGDA